MSVSVETTDIPRPEILDPIMVSVSRSKVAFGGRESHHGAGNPPLILLLALANSHGQPEPECNGADGPDQEDKGDEQGWMTPGHVQFYREIRPAGDWNERYRNDPDLQPQSPQALKG